MVFSPLGPHHLVKYTLTPSYRISLSISPSRATGPISQPKVAEEAVEVVKEVKTVEVAKEAEEVTEAAKEVKAAEAAKEAEEEVMEAAKEVKEAEAAKEADGEVKEAAKEVKETMDAWLWSMAWCVVRFDLRS
jgi:rRNA maturation endonuclease Nob1